MLKCLVLIPDFSLVVLVMLLAVAFGSVKYLLEDQFFCQLLWDFLWELVALLASDSVQKGWPYICFTCCVLFECFLEEATDIAFDAFLLPYLDYLWVLESIWLTYGFPLCLSQDFACIMPGDATYPLQVMVFLIGTLQPFIFRTHWWLYRVGWFTIFFLNRILERLYLVLLMRGVAHLQRRPFPLELNSLLYLIDFLLPLICFNRYFHPFQLFLKQLLLFVLVHLGLCFVRALELLGE